MNNSPNRVRGLFSTGAVFIVGICVAGLILGERARNRHALDEARRESAALRTELEARDRAMAGSRLDLQPARVVDAASDQSKVSRDISASSNLQIDLFQRIAELTAQQSNTAAMVQRLLARTWGDPSPEQAKRGTQAAIQVLQASMQNNQQQLETARQKAAALLVDLNIPVEIASMEASEALDQASLREYWPFFEAKREGDTLRELAERLRRRMIQERVDGATSPGDLEALAQEGRQQLENARQRARDLLSTLNVPANVVTMDVDKALRTTALRPYWPFFEAKRERETLQGFGDQLQRRLIQEQIDAAIAAARAGNQ